MLRTRRPAEKVACRRRPDEDPGRSEDMSGHDLRLGAFPVSLAVRDLQASRTFYEQSGFSVFHGVAEQGWLILRNETATIGLFQGMFERNLLMFNPGWDADAQPVGESTDVRELQWELESPGRGHRDPGRRVGQWTRASHGRGPGRQPHPGRPARLTGQPSPRSPVARSEIRQRLEELRGRHGGNPRPQVEQVCIAGHEGVGPGVTREVDEVLVVGISAERLR
jgi:hypothetical protein